MTAEQWEELAAHCDDHLESHRESESYEEHDILCEDQTCCYPTALHMLGLALFARMMAVAMKPCGDSATDTAPASYRRRIALDLLRSSSSADGRYKYLEEYLRAYHAGNPSALNALLGEAWGERPDGNVCTMGGYHTAKSNSLCRCNNYGLGRDEPICLCPATSEYDPPCPQHGILGVGVTGR